ncbi:MAG: ATP-binding protein, partial [Bdellovibrionales bacterium]
QKVSLNDIIKKTLPLLKTMISPFDVQLDFTAENCDVFVQPQLMQQVVFNIIKNAAQAMGNSGKLSVRTFITKNDHLNAVEEGLVANISIEDTGGGVEKEIEKQIFDFFFTTKSSGQGTGIGLSMSKNIVDRFGGDIRLENQIGIGSKFIISLPILSAN